MGLIAFIMNPFRYVLGQTMRNVFAEEVRRNPIVVHAEAQSDDVGTSVNGEAARRGPNGEPMGFRKAREATQGFKPQYVAPWHPPHTDVEAQRLYNHIRTLAFYLDAIPFLGRRLPFNIGVDSILGLIPGVGDYFGLILSLYALLLSAMFGLPWMLLCMMLFNVIVDCTIGLVPIVGDALDVAFKANLRNLRLLEDHLIKNDGKCGAGTFCLLIPPSDVFMPPKRPPHVAMQPVAGGEQARKPVPSQKSANARLRHVAQNDGDGESGGTSLMPDGTMKYEWTSTDAGGSSVQKRQDFRKGTSDVHGDVERDGGAIVLRSTSSVVPEEIFTTMRFEAEGISLAEACAPLLNMLPFAEKANDEMWTKKETILLRTEHMERLRDAIHRMRQAYPQTWNACFFAEDRITKHINAHIDDLQSPSSLRVRVGVRCDGQITVTSASLPSTAHADVPAKTVRSDPMFICGWKGFEEQERLPFVVKTSNRQMYDDARARVNATLGLATTANDARRPACFDVLLSATSMRKNVREDRTLTESSIANVILVHADGRAVTSRSDAPLLPGLMRNKLLQMGCIKEQTIVLREAKSLCSSGQATLFLCNALRGVMKAEWQET